MPQRIEKICMEDQGGETQMAKGEFVSLGALSWIFIP